jgi:hypothetical protein
MLEQRSTSHNTRNQLRRYAPQPSAHAPGGARLVSLSRYVKSLWTFFERELSFPHLSECGQAGREWTS